MKISKQPTIVVVVAIAFMICPLLIMGNCSGWNEGSGKVTSCLVDFGFARSAAEFFYSWLLISVFTLGLPLYVYLLLVGIILKILKKKISKNKASALPEKR